MKSLENLVNVLSDCLFIKSTFGPCGKSSDTALTMPVQITLTSVPEETKNTFKTLMLEHINSKLQGCKTGHSIVYDYYAGKIRGSKLGRKESWGISINQNMLDILDNLPSLEEGEEYAFPSVTSASIKVIGFDGRIPIVSIGKCSDWIVKALAIT